MNAPSHLSTEPRSFDCTGELVPLDWDTRNFGFTVARIQSVRSDTDAVAALLGRARRLGVDMVVWSTAPQTRVPRELLDEFRGELVDEKATFVASVTSTPVASGAADGNEQCAGKPSVCQYMDEAATDELIALGIAAGAYSRFHVDPRFPHHKFEQLYRIWIERSVRGELADAVLIARDPIKPSAGLLGMVTVSAAEGVGTIGLIAVAEAARGRGVGRRLILAAHAWMRKRGAVEARVVTQRANLPACRLYERAGYRLSTLEHYYHFWPQVGR